MKHSELDEVLEYIIENFAEPVWAFYIHTDEEVQYAMDLWDRVESHLRKQTDSDWQVNGKLAKSGLEGL